MEHEHEPEPDNGSGNDFPTADEFWDKIESILAEPCADHDAIDDALRSYLAILDAHYRDYITTDDHLGHCAYLLYASPLFTQHAAYIRQQLIYCLLQEEEVSPLRIAAVFLLADARENDSTFDLLNKEGTFPRLVDLIAHPKENEESLHRTLMELLYEMSRIQKITNDDLTCINDEFVCAMFELIEQASDDVNDPYHYPIIRVLLVLNEQFMVAAHDPAVFAKKSAPLTNKVVKVLSSHGSRYRTFGANIILLLNREDETSLQLLTLKLMYLLFTTPPTYEYFYTTDLRVLVDILIRNLLDLPEYKASLRHTYLRVLYPLLEHTQLQYPPYYKRHEIQKLLALLCGDRVENEDGSPHAASGWTHFEDVDETTKRLVKRCRTVSWIIDPDTEVPQAESPIDDKSLNPESPTSPAKKPPQLPAPRKLRKRDSSKASTLTIGGFLTPQLEGARQSSISMVEMAQQKEKPGIITPSRTASVKSGLRQAIFAKKEKPPPPKARRSGAVRPQPTQTPSLSLTDTTGDGITLSATPSLRDEGENFEDAVEEQEKDDQDAEAIAPPSPTQTRPPLPDHMDTESAVTQAEISSASETSSRPPMKKPPPAPKARRGWRMRKSKDLTEEQDKEPGKFSTNLPSVKTELQSPFSPPAEGIPEDSPFSPVKEEKTLDPLQGTRSPTSPGTGEPKRSVSDALNQAQVQAVHDVEDCLEHTHLTDPTEHHPNPPVPTLHHPPRSTSLLPPHQPNNDQPQPSPPQPQPLQRTVLAPPSQARAVPGPTVNLEKSPFLSDDEQDTKGSESPQKDDDQEPDLAPASAPEPAPAPAPGGVQGGVHALKARDSWEDFDNDA